MKKILIVGAGGQIGSELVPHLRSLYGNNNVVAADISAEKCKALAEAGPFEELNALDGVLIRFLTWLLYCRLPEKKIRNWHGTLISEH